MIETNKKIDNVLGFDPTKDEPISSVLNDVLLEIKAERTLANKAKAKTQLIKLMDLRIQFDKQKKEFDKVVQKFEKEVNSLLRIIQGDTSENNTFEVSN